MLFLALKKVGMVKLIPPQILTYKKDILFKSQSNKKVISTRNTILQQVP